MKERYELAIERIQCMVSEDKIEEKYSAYCLRTAQLFLTLNDIFTAVNSGGMEDVSTDELKRWNVELYLSLIHI